MPRIAFRTSIPQLITRGTTSPATPTRPLVGLIIGSTLIGILFLIFVLLHLRRRRRRVRDARRRDLVCQSISVLSSAGKSRPLADIHPALRTSRIVAPLEILPPKRAASLPEYRLNPESRRYTTLTYAGTRHGERNMAKTFPPGEGRHRVANRVLPSRSSMPIIGDMATLHFPETSEEIRRSIDESLSPPLEVLRWNVEKKWEGQVRTPAAVCSDYELTVPLEREWSTGGLKNGSQRLAKAYCSRLYENLSPNPKTIGTEKERQSDGERGLEIKATVGRSNESKRS